MNPEELSGFFNGGGGRGGYENVLKSESWKLNPHPFPNIKTFISLSLSPPPVKIPIYVFTTHKNLYQL